MAEVFGVVADTIRILGALNAATEPAPRLEQPSIEDKHETPTERFKILRNTLRYHLRLPQEPAGHELPRKEFVYRRMKDRHREVPSHYTALWIYVGNGELKPVDLTCSRLIDGKRYDFSSQDLEFLDGWVRSNWPRDGMDTRASIKAKRIVFHLRSDGTHTPVDLLSLQTYKDDSTTHLERTLWLLQGSPNTSRGEVVYIHPDTDRFVMSLHTFAMLLYYAEPFYESSLVNSRINFDLTHTLHYVDRSPYRGNIHNAEVGLELVYRQRYLTIDRPSKSCWLSANRNQEHGTRVAFIQTPDSGLYMSRQVASIGEGVNKFHLREVRSSVRLVLRNSHSNFHITVLDDLGKSHPDAEFGTTGSSKDRWQSLGLKPSQSGIGVSQMLDEIWRIFGHSMQHWASVLESVNEICAFSLDDFIHQDHLEEVMFDPSFNRSKTYFTVLQVLRMVDGWLGDNLASFQSIREDGLLDLANFESHHKKILTENLQTLETNMARRVNVLRSQVQTKMAEIQSLRDGLFNATSLRETTKGMALNQAVYIFTAVTVFFTPVSFLATFWALPFLNNPTGNNDIVPEPYAFRSTFIVLPLLTYLIVILIAWAAAPSYGRFTLRGIVVRSHRYLLPRARTLWTAVNICGKAYSDSFARHHAKFARAGGWGALGVEGQRIEAIITLLRLIVCPLRDMLAPLMPGQLDDRQQERQL